MALQAQTLPVSFNQGIDTKTDPKKVPVGKLLVLENATFQNLERFNKRNGTNILVGPIAPAAALATLRDELVILSTTRLFSYPPSGGEVLHRGPYIPMNVTSAPIVNNGAIYDSPDVCYDPATNHTLLLYQFATSISYTIIDNFNNSPLFFNLTVDTGKPCKVLLFQNLFVVLFFDTVNNELRYRTIVPATGVLGPPHTIGADINLGTPWFDCAVFNNHLYFAYSNNIAATTANLLNAAFVLGGPQLIAQASNTCIGLFGDVANNCWIMLGSAPDLQAIIMTPALAVLVPAFPVDNDIANDVCNVSGIYTNGVGNVFFEKRINSGSNREYFNFISTCTITVGGAVGAVTIPVRGLGLWSKPFVVNAVIYMLTAYGADAQSQNVGGGSILNSLSNQQQYFMISADGRVCGKIGFGSGGGVTLAPKLCEVPASIAGKFLIPYLYSNVTNRTGGEIVPFYSVYLGTFDYTSTVHSMKAEAGNELHLSGGFISMYDGLNVVEHGFHLYPEQVMSSATASTGVALGIGKYQYAYAYAWVDADGQIHRSAPTFLNVATTAGNQDVDLIIPYLRVTAKTRGTFLEIYRTQVDQTLLYQINAFSINNNTNQDVFAFTDDTPDSLLPTNPFIYTYNGEFENIAAPPSNILGLSQERIFLIPSTDAKTFWYSKQVIPGSPVEFSDFLVGNINPIGGDITAVAQMDDKTIFFKKTTCWYMTGSGPAANGSNNDFSDPQLIPTGKGCINAVSVILTPLGLMYQSLAGIYLLDRGLNSTYIGAPVEAFNSFTITSAVLVPNTTFVRFSLSNGTVLNYDYLTNQWSVFTNMSATDAIIYNNTYMYFGNQNVIQEINNNFTDFDGSYISMKIVTSWIPLAGIQGFQRAYFGLILGDYYSPHTLQMQIAYDYDPALVQTIQVGVPVAQVPYQNQFLFAQQKCQAIQFTIKDLAPPNPVDYGHGCDLSELTLEVGLKKGLFKVPASQKYG